MELKKTTVLVAVTLAFVALSARDAAAQAPVLTVAVNGTTVTIDFTPVAGAQGYNIQVGTGQGLSNIADLVLPPSITHIVVSAPAGLYWMRVRAVAGNVQGPFSNDASIAVGAAPPGPCEQLTAPTASVTVGGTAVSINWTPVAGSLGYRVEISRTSGTTELVYNVLPHVTSLSYNVPLVGTFYLRVVAGNACGIVISPEVQFVLGAPAPPPPGGTPPPGGGNRAPNPPPGQLLPLPSYGEAVMFQVAAVYRGDLANACSSRLYLYRLVNELRKRDTRWGLNYKRGHIETSTDVITYNPTDRPDQYESKVYLVDVISAVCEGNLPVWNTNTTAETWGCGHHHDPTFEPQVFAACPPRNHPDCGTPYCAKWQIDGYSAAGFVP